VRNYFPENQIQNALRTYGAWSSGWEHTGYQDLAPTEPERIIYNCILKQEGSCYIDFFWYNCAHSIYFLFKINTLTFFRELINSFNQSITQSVNQSINQPVNQSVNQSINQSVSQSITQSLNH
jgi:hypothetical protein